MRILYLDIDTLRPDHLGCYGYNRNTSPNIDSVSGEGVRFENYYCSDAPCLPSRTALMTGKFGIHTGVVNHGGITSDMRLEGSDRSFTGRLSNENLPGILRNKNINTISISSFADRHGAWHFYAGFNEIYNTGKKGMESAEEVTPFAIDWIKRKAKNDNWFLHINFWDPHTPYRAPDHFGNPFKDSPIPDWITEDILNKHIRMVGCAKPANLYMYDDYKNPNYSRYPGEIKDMDDLKQVIDGYDCGIKYMDENIGHIFEALKDEGVFDDLAIIISSDHGENFGELGIYAEHGTADNATSRIPLIIKWPKGKKETIDNGLHYNLDLLPTLAELLNIENLPDWDGDSFAPVITNGEDKGRDYLILGQCAHVCQRSVRFSDWLYIRTYHDGFHLFPKDMLFNLKKDPYQQENIASKYPDIVNEAVYKLNNWHDDMMSSMEYDIDPLWSVMKEGGPFHAKGELKKYCDFLKKTNRSYAIEELKRKHPEEFM